VEFPDTPSIAPKQGRRDCKGIVPLLWPSRHNVWQPLDINSQIPNVTDKKKSVDFRYEGYEGMVLPIAILFVQIVLMSEQCSVRDSNGKCPYNFPYTPTG
jgi:hypothetical protein